MYKLKNILFGYDYIYWKNSCDNGIARVHRAGDGKVYYFRYKTTNLIDLIQDPNQVIWLTCSPDKYLNPEKYRYYKQ